MLRRLLVLTIAALLALALAGPPAMPRPAQAAGPGMSLAAPASVAVGETFTVSVNADPAPDEEITGFNSAVLLPDGLTWLPRPNCEGPGPDSEVQVQRQDGEPLALCFSYLTTDLQAVAHSVSSNIGLGTPLTVTPGATTTLIELDVQCAAPGTYDVVLLAVPFSLIGAIWFLYMADYNMSLAVWVGLIALAGLDAETGMVMLLYLHNSHDRAKAEGRMNSLADLKTAIHEGAVLRIRPKTMTVLTTMMALVPIMIGTGTGSAVMKRMAAPMFGGLLSSFVMELLIYPVIFLVAKQFQMLREKSKTTT